MNEKNDTINKSRIIEKLYGSVHDTGLSLEDIREERLRKYEYVKDNDKDKHSND